MRSLCELTGQDLWWKVQPGSVMVPDRAQHSYVLFMGDEPVVQAQVIWQHLVSFEVIMEAGEGTYQVHMDLADPKRRSEVWKDGEAQSAAKFELASEEGITASGWINSASQRKLAWAPTHEASAYLVGSAYLYVIFAPGGPRLVSVPGATLVHIGGTSGQMMTLAPEMAADADLAPLVALGFALANEQMMQLDKDWGPDPDKLESLAAHVLKLFGVQHPNA